ncbi:MAG TPA: ABC transporter ATP-binding protein [Acetobacteraceae bacterium]|nr:ABC transporter ATP-binding protein [Acetobacteraceae bacterium]
MTLLLEAEGIEAYYGKSHILHGVSLSVAEGEVVTLLGRNGAGKTTTLRAIMRLTPPREGRVRIFGQDVTGWPTHRIARGSGNGGVGYVPEGRHMFRHLTVEENLRVPPPTPGQWSLATIFSLFPRLAERRTSKAGRLSGGEQEMLAIARALLLNPRLLLLDEPSQGLAPVIVEEVMQAVRRMRSEGTAILLVEQNAILALAFADRAYVLSDGAIIHEGPAAELAADSEKVKSLAGARASRAA